MSSLDWHQRYRRLSGEQSRDKKPHIIQIVNAHSMSGFVGATSGFLFKLDTLYIGNIYKFILPFQ
jgi:hypothetical protein